LSRIGLPGILPAPWVGDSSSSRCRVYDGLHVTSDGSRVYAEYITQRLLETALRGRGEKSPRGVPH